MTADRLPSDEPSVDDLAKALAKNPLAEMYRAHLKATEGKCWDCGVELDPDDSVNGYCADCADEKTHD